MTYTYELRYYCPRSCGRSYSRKNNMKRHLTFECGVPKLFMCSYCGRDFTYRSNLKIHIYSIHGRYASN
eukprot:XP_016662416.1 PREDICTED: putative transcription factor ovo-like protein 3 isoform X3 [Acyrthosiphon pisum]